ncbi:glycosyltransferase [Halomonas sp. FME65]|uniref:glycosyltransferase n=1 Tax=Halomonas sp. FME65 TaxID=2742614 RepID=UPI00186677E4|nr:glycosyltransferase [Halomonas sp. FME65]
MKIIVFDEILEVHVCDALATGLTLLGHIVHRTGKVWKGHKFPGTTEEEKPIDRLIDDLCESNFDALINFRASSLLPKHVKKLRHAGIKTVVWLPDDPVLYSLCYNRVVDHYDLVLHCGDRGVLNFYDTHNHLPGMNFPFWVDPGVFSVGRSGRSQLTKDSPKPWVFFGNLGGQVRQGRYDVLSKLSEGLDIWGQCPKDPHGMHRGYLKTIDSTIATLPQYQVGINIPQNFEDYHGSNYDFLELSNLGKFFLPSRVIQYAALELPVLTIGVDSSPSHFTSSLVAENSAKALDCLNGVLSSTAMKQELAAHGRAEICKHFSGVSRARFLVALLQEDLTPSQLGLHEREFAYRWFGGAYKDKDKDGMAG